MAIGFVSLTLLAPATAGEKVALVGWGVDRKNLDACFAEAHKVGFDTLITWSTEPAFLAKAVAAGTKHGIEVYSSLAPMSGFAALWKKTYPGEPVPWQEMTTEQEAARTFLSAGRNHYITPFQQYHPRQQGVGMIGYYNSPGKFPAKSAEQVDLELRTMIQNGCRRIQVCGTTHVLRNPDIAAVFTRHCGRK